MKMNSSPGGPGGTAKPKGKGNASILSFFKKADPSSVSLFIEEAAPSTCIGPPGGELKRTGSRYNEDSVPVKRRKFCVEEVDVESDLFHVEPAIVTETEDVPEDDTLSIPTAQGIEKMKKSTGTAYNPSLAEGPFMDEDEISSDEGPDNVLTASIGDDNDTSATTPEHSSNGVETDTSTKFDEIRLPDQKVPIKTEADDPTSLLRAETSTGSALIDDEFRDLEGEDQYPGGDEYADRKWMAEERRLELEEAGIDPDDAEFDGLDLNSVMQTNEDDTRCPICNVGLGGIKPDDATLHVNHCLDGTPIPLPQKAPPIKRQGSSKSILAGAALVKPSRAPKPAQAEPNASGIAPSGPGSAFSALMSGHGEEAAFAAAAAADSAARGKPAYQRTCPFYKIMPGFFICVDGFRYGAVEGMKAYFLSHFHSDHYVGLTSSWNHGPIYASKVTCNLIRQQLRVKPEFVIPLEFEQKTEVPGTKDAYVTMIPANHCPGSSLFLFEKEIKTGSRSKTQRILHCGDFRACPAHVTHPALRPQLLNDMAQVIGSQKIDTCYLDTTYLNPKYAFPSQEDVIKACADMCLSLKAEIVDPDDAFEVMKRERAGAGMATFVSAEVRTFKGEDAIQVQDEKYALSVNRPTTAGKPRGRLLIVVGTYSIGKERICMGIASALDSKIYAPAAKLKICAALEDPELSARLTSDPLAAQVHMTPLFEIRAETLQEYLDGFAPHFSRVVGFRPSGWTYRPPSGRFVENPAVRTVLEGESWRSRYSIRELVPQRGSGRTASCFGVPYSEHSSFRELTMFCMSLDIEKVVPTVNVGSAKGRERMKRWVEKWKAERVKAGFWDPEKGGW